MTSGRVTPGVDDAAFRGALSRFASGVTVCSTVVHGVDHLMTASAFTSVSLDPPQVLVCSHQVSRFDSAVRAAGLWGVSILSEADMSAAAWFARRGRQLEGQLDSVAHLRGESGVALLDNALAWLECTTVATHNGGDHTIIVGQVTAAGFRDDRDDPLLYYRSHFGTMIRRNESERTQYGTGDSKGKQ